MSYLVMARKYRPEAFDEIVGQKAITKTLQNALKSGRIAHAFLFSGPHGVGKTSMARILAKCLNCAEGPTITPCQVCDACQAISTGSDVDVIEIDGASKRKIDNIKEVIQNVIYAPTRSKHKIYIIDEVHMLTKEAFNALLKTLEEPPKHVKFIFATTDPQKVPETIRSRCQHFEFSRMTVADVCQRLADICKTEDVQAEQGALEALARNTSGSMRDAQSALDQLVGLTAGNKIQLEDVEEMFGLLPSDDLDAFLSLLAGNEQGPVLLALNKMLQRMRPVLAASQLADAFRNLLAAATPQAADILVDFPHERVDALKKQAGLFTNEALLAAIQMLVQAAGKMQRGLDDRILLELTLLRILRAKDMLSIGEVLARLEKMESGAPYIAPSPALPSPAASVAPASSTTPAAPADTKKADPAENEQADVQEEPTPDAQTGLEDMWRKVITEIKAQTNKPFTAALLKDAVPQKIEEDELFVGFAPQFRFHRDQLNTSDKRHVVELALKRVTGKNMKLQFVTLSGEGAGADTATMEQLAQGAQAHVQTEDEAYTATHPLVKKALRIFDGHIVTVTT